MVGFFQGGRAGAGGGGGGLTAGQASALDTAFKDLDVDLRGDNITGVAPTWWPGADAGDRMIVRLQNGTVEMWSFGSGIPDQTYTSGGSSELWTTETAVDYTTVVEGERIRVDSTNAVTITIASGHQQIRVGRVGANDITVISADDPGTTVAGAAGGAIINEDKNTFDFILNGTNYRPVYYSGDAAAMGGSTDELVETIDLSTAVQHFIDLEDVKYANFAIGKRLRIEFLTVGTLVDNVQFLLRDSIDSGSNFPIVGYGWSYGGGSVANSSGVPGGAGNSYYISSSAAADLIGNAAGEYYEATLIVSNALDPAYRTKVTTDAFYAGNDGVEHRYFAGGSQPTAAITNQLRLETSTGTGWKAGSVMKVYITD